MRSSIGSSSRCWAASTPGVPTSCRCGRRCRRSQPYRAQRSLLRALRARPSAPGTGPVFAGLVGGVGRLAEVLTAAISAAGADVVLDAAVRSLERLPVGFRLVTGSAASPKTIRSGRRRARVTRNAGSAVAGSSVAHGPPLDLAAIEYASMAIVTLAYSASAFGKPLTGSGFLVPAVDGRLIKAATFSTQKWGWYDESDGVLVRCSIGRHRRCCRPPANRRRAGRGRGARSRGGRRGAGRAARRGRDPLGRRLAAVRGRPPRPGRSDQVRARSPYPAWRRAVPPSTASEYPRASAAGRRAATQILGKLFAARARENRRHE